MKTVKITALFAVLIILGALVGAVFTVKAAVPEAIWLSWQNDPSTTMTIRWRTESAQTSALVEYDTKEWLEHEVPGTTTQAIEAGKWYHTVELTGLEPDTLYYYRVQGTSGVWTELMTFRTAPAETGDFNFAVFGDNGTMYDGAAESQTIKNLIAGVAPEFVLAAGDLSYADGDKCASKVPCVERSWEQWFTEITSFAKHSPVMAVMGEREVTSDMHFAWGEFYFTRSVAQPAAAGESTYSFDYGDAHIVGLNSNDIESLAGGWQYRWLLDDLAATTKPWKVVFFHHPVYSSGDKGSTAALQNWLGPLFDQFDVDVVFNAHNRGYERTFPLRTGEPGSVDAPTVASIDPGSYVTPNGTVYVVTGGGGAGLDAHGEQPAWSASVHDGFQFMNVAVAGTTMTVTSVGKDGETIDAFTISHADGTEPTPAPVPVPEPLPTPVPEASGGVAADWPIRGFNFPSWWHDEYAQTMTHESLDALAETGATWVTVTPVWYQDAWNSSNLGPHATKSPSDDALRSIIRAAKAQGLQVALKPMVDSLDGAWRGFFAPKNPDVWMARYRSFVLDQARLAAEEKVDLFIAGTELRNLTTPKYDKVWRSLIADVRSRYTGDVTYNANWQGEYENIIFWDALDMIALSANFPIATTLDGSVEHMVAGWRGGVGTHWFRDLELFQRQWNKDILFAEIGYQARNGSGILPWHSNGGLDEEEQARAYQAAFTVWADVPWMRGMLFWHWPTDPMRAGANDDTSSVREKLAESVVKQFWVSK